MFKYASAHHGIDTLADYLTDIGPSRPDDDPAQRRRPGPEQGRGRGPIR